MCPDPTNRGGEPHDIILKDAIILTQKYKSSVPTGSKRAYYFEKEALDGILSPEVGDCAGLRIYYGIKGNGEPTLVIVGVDKSRGDLTGGKLAEYGIPDLSAANSSL